MNELLFTALDVACIVNNLDLTVKSSAELVRKIFYEDNDFIAPKYKDDYRKWFIDICYWSNYLYDKVTFDKEFPAIQKDCGGLLNEKNFVTDDFNLELFFKLLRVKILYVGEKNYVRMKLRTLLSNYGYKRRSKEFIAYVKESLKFNGIDATFHGELCDVSEISLDDMITFRIF